MSAELTPKEEQMYNSRINFALIKQSDVHYISFCYHVKFKGFVHQFMFYDDSLDAVKIHSITEFRQHVGCNFGEAKLNDATGKIDFKRTLAQRTVMFESDVDYEDFLEIVKVNFKKFVKNPIPKNRQNFFSFKRVSMPDFIEYNEKFQQKALETIKSMKIENKKEPSLSSYETVVDMPVPLHHINLAPGSHVPENKPTNEYTEVKKVKLKFVSEGTYRYSGDKECYSGMTCYVKEKDIRETPQGCLAKVTWIGHKWLRSEILMNDLTMVAKTTKSSVRRSEGDYGSFGYRATTLDDYFNDPSL